MSDELQAQKQELEAEEGVERTRSARLYRPPVDIYSDEQGIMIVADMPGVSQGDVDITLDKNVLTIRGYVNVSALTPQGYDLAHAEYGIGDYQRTFAVPEDIDRNNIEAHLNHGVLRVHLPKAPEVQARKIEVKSA